MYDIPFDRSFLQLSNGIRHVMPSTDRKLELTAKASMDQPVSQPAVYCNVLSFSDFTGSAYLLFWAPAKHKLHGPLAKTFCLENTEFVISEVTSISSAVCTPT